MPAAQAEAKQARDAALKALGAETTELAARDLGFPTLDALCEQIGLGERRLCLTVVQVGGERGCPVDTRDGHTGAHVGEQPARDGGGESATQLRHVQTG